MSDPYLLTEKSEFLVTEDGERIVVEKIEFWRDVPRVETAHAWEDVPNA